MDTSSENEVKLTDENLRFVKELAEKLGKTPEEMVNIIVSSFKGAGYKTSQIMRMFN